MTKSRLSILFRSFNDDTHIMADNAKNLDIVSKLSPEHHEGAAGIESDHDTLSVWATVCRFKKVQKHSASAAE
jgi:hypothetical protein